MVPTGNMMPIAIDAQDCMSALVYEEKAGSGPVWPWLLVLDLRCDKKWHHGSGEKGDILRERERKRAAWEDGDGSRRQVSWLMGYLSGQVPPSFLDKLGLSENFVDCCLRRSTSHQGRQPGWISTSKSQPISWQHCFSASTSTSGKLRDKGQRIWHVQPALLVTRVFCEPRATLRHKSQRLFRSLLDLLGR